MDMKNLLFEASLEGSVSSLQALLIEDPLILNRYNTLNLYNETPLHVASMLGHFDFVREILKQKPELASKMNSKRSSPLHLASAIGYVEIVKELLLVNPDMCLSCDKDGWNPVHLAAMNGNIDVVKELLRARVHVARAMAPRGEGILHLCVKNNQLEALKLLVETLSDHEFVNSKDDDGHTILHVAVTDKQIETVKFLLLNTSIEVNEPNGDGITAMGILARSQRDVHDKEIMKSLRRAGAIEEIVSNSVPQPQNHTESLLNRRDLTILESSTSDKKIVKEGPVNNHKWLEKKQSTIMVVASLIATMAFQVGVNPPGGVWQDFKNTDSTTSPPETEKVGHYPGSSILADMYPRIYKELITTNTISFISSLSIILLLISGLPIKRRIFMFILMVTMWIAVTTSSFTFLIAMLALTPDDKICHTPVHVVRVVVVVWMGLMGTLIFAHTIRLIIKGIRKLRKFFLKKRARLSRLITHHEGA